MNFPDQIFKAYDIRGIVDAELTVALAEKIGRALGVEARVHCNRVGGDGDGNSDGDGGDDRVPAFFVGRDGRNSGTEISAAVMRGICASGCDVADIGMMPTPVLYFATAHGDGDGHGVEVTASHNPPDYNGMKMMIAGDTLFGERIQQLKERIIADDFTVADDRHRHGKQRKFDAWSAYRKKLLGDINIAKPLTIVMDCGNGVAGAVAPDLFRALGCSVIELFCEVDGNFPNHHPDPSCPENLTDLAASVIKNNADFGIAFDGDGDRLGVVSADGTMILPDRLMLLFVESLLRGDGDKKEILFDVKCSRLLPRAIEQYGGIATMCKTGHSFIKHELKKPARDGAQKIFAGEMSGHLFFNDRWGGFDDGLYAAARLCELLSQDARAPSEIFAALPNTVNTPELRLEMQHGEAHLFVEELLANADFADGTVTDVDGLRVDFPDGFGLIRASNTTPTLIMRFEADTATRLTVIQNQFRSLLLATRKNLQLPF